MHSLDKSSAFNLLLEIENGQIISSQSDDDTRSIFGFLKDIFTFPAVTINNIVIVLEQLVEAKQRQRNLWWDDFFDLVKELFAMKGVIENNILEVIELGVRLANVDWDNMAEKLTLLSVDKDGAEPGAISIGDKEIKATRILSLSKDDLLNLERKSVELFREKNLTQQNVDFYHHIKQLVNPDNKNAVCIYPGAGADMTSVLLSTNASVIYILDKCRLFYRKPTYRMGAYLLTWAWKEKDINVLLHHYRQKTIDDFLHKVIVENIRERRRLSTRLAVDPDGFYFEYSPDDLHEYSNSKEARKGAFVPTMILSGPANARKGWLPWASRPTFLGNILEPFLLECFALGINEVSIWQRAGAEDSTTIAKFLWQHPDAEAEKERTVIYIGGIDLLAPNLSEITIFPPRFDIYFEKALSPHADPYEVECYREIRKMCRRLNNGGFAIVDNYGYRNRLHFLESLPEEEKTNYKLIPVREDMGKIPFGHSCIKIYKKNRGEALNAVNSSSPVNGKAQDKPWWKGSKRFNLAVSLPIYALRRQHNDPGIGKFTDLGGYYRDVLKKQGVNVILLLPHFAVFDESPYAPLSLYALNELFIDWANVAEVKQDEELLVLSVAPESEQTQVNYIPVRSRERKVAFVAWQRFKEEQVGRNTSRAAEFDIFVKENSSWLNDYAVYAALTELIIARASNEWTQQDIERAKNDPRYQFLVSLHEFSQWVAYSQFKDALAVVRKHGGKVLFDLPMFRAKTSLDAFMFPEYFKPEGNPGIIRDGLHEDWRDLALWNWARLKEENYAFILDPVRHWLDFGFDGARMDALHFAYNFGNGQKASGDEQGADFVAALGNVFKEKCAFALAEAYEGKRDDVEREGFATIKGNCKVLSCHDDPRWFDTKEKFINTIKWFLTYDSYFGDSSRFVLWSLGDQWGDPLPVKIFESGRSFWRYRIPLEKDPDYLSRVRFDASRELSVLAALREGRLWQLGYDILHALKLAADSFVKSFEAAQGREIQIWASSHSQDWFNEEWGRDTFISLTGILLATGRFEEARSNIYKFSRFISEKGLIPNRIRGNHIEYNTVDASLWFIQAIKKYLEYTQDLEFGAAMLPVVRAIIEGYRTGTGYERYNRFNSIYMDNDALIVSPAQATWMDADPEGRDHPVTPRNGKAVEINALWYADLIFVSSLGLDYLELAAKVKGSFNAKFWNEAEGALYDVIEGDSHKAAIRPNMIFAVSLTKDLLSPERQASVLNRVTQDLLTPFGLRTLSPRDSHYHARYYTSNPPVEKDLAYHQGTVWPWLIGSYIDALVRVREQEGIDNEKIKTQVRAVIGPLVEFLLTSHYASIPEVFDGGYPDDFSLQLPGGTKSQAWSVAEVLRVLTEYKVIQDKTSSSPVNGAIFTIPDSSIDKEFAAKLAELNELNARSGCKAVTEAVLADPYLTLKISRLIRAQDRLDETSGFAVAVKWAKGFKKEALAKAIEQIKGTDIFILQMEYELSMKLLQEFCNHLIKAKGCSVKDAVYNTGEVAKILMAGGLGSFKPDLVRGWYKVLEEYLGSLEARRRLNVFGILYSKAIKGQGAINCCGAIKEENIVDILREVLTKVKTCQDIEIPYRDLASGKWGVKLVSVDIYMNPYSELNEYWIYCPEVFHEAYCGDSDDDFRAIQTLLYRKVVLRFIEEGLREGLIEGKKILFSTSEVNTTLAMPRVIEDEYRNSPTFKNLLVHHYNHTIVPAGMPRYSWYMFNILKIAEEFKSAIHDGKVDLAIITGMVSDILTGCGTKHTGVLLNTIFKDFADKIAEDELFGNSEGSDIYRWQGKEITILLNKYMVKTGAKDYCSLFEKLDKSESVKSRFIRELLAIKKKQKKVFIEELFKGTFGNIGLSRKDLKQLGVNLIGMPFFTFVRRLVDYKCADFIVETLYDANVREILVATGAVIFIGGRRFSDFADRVKSGVEQLAQLDPRMKYHLIFIENHNVFTSYFLQQGVDFGGMLSWKDMEAGPTSISNSAQNGSPTIATPDGVIPERVKPIKRDSAGKVISGTGYIVEYEGSPSRDGQTRPDRNAFIQKLQEASLDYHHQENYGLIAYNILRMGLTQGDITNQARGLIRIWAKMVKDGSSSSPINSIKIKSLRINIEEFDLPSVAGGIRVPAAALNLKIRPQIQSSPVNRIAEVFAGPKSLEITPQAMPQGPPVVPLSSSPIISRRIFCKIAPFIPSAIASCAKIPEEDDGGPASPQPGRTPHPEATIDAIPDDGTLPTSLYLEPTGTPSLVVLNSAGDPIEDEDVYNTMGLIYNNNDSRRALIGEPGWVIDADTSVDSSLYTKAVLFNFRQRLVSLTDGNLVLFIRADGFATIKVDIEDTNGLVGGRDRETGKVTFIVNGLDNTFKKVVLPIQQYIDDGILVNLDRVSVIFNDLNRSERMIQPVNGSISVDGLGELPHITAEADDAGLASNALLVGLNTFTTIDDSLTGHNWSALRYSVESGYTISHLNYRIDISDEVVGLAAAFEPGTVILDAGNNLVFYARRRSDGPSRFNLGFQQKDVVTGEVLQNIAFVVT
ncbi:MAG: 4-alpha-glucanotransferase, partial [Candidatus Omnitrophica bacterium]|nr:4-alpha-glucanotransferase [Candidatus Omnitrophota bacterium]